MIPALLLLLLLAAPGVNAAQADAAPPTSVVDGDLGSILQEVSQFGPRREGSPGEAALCDWLRTKAQSMGMRATAFDFSRSDFEHSFSQNVRVDVPGRSTDSLIVVVPIDAEPGAPDGQDGSAGVALAVDLLAHLRGSPPPLSLIVLFLGAEYGDAAPYPMGSTLFLRDFQPSTRTSVLYLNVRAAPRSVRVRGAGRGIVTPYWLMKRCRDALESARVSFRLPADELQAFRLGTTDERTLIEPWLQAGLPSVGIQGEYGSGPAGADMLPALASFLRAFLAFGGDGTPEEWDHHYFIVQVGARSLIVDETTYIAMLGGAFAVVLLFSLVAHERLKKYVRTLVRNIGAIVPLAAIAFVFLLVATWAVEAIPLVRGFPTVWKYAPLEFLGLKVVVALLLYAVLYNPFRRFPFPRNGSFYSAAAIFFLLVEITLVSLFDVSFTWYFLWAFFFVFLSTLFSNRWLKLAFALPSPFWGIRGIVTVFQLPAFPFSHILTLSPVMGNLVVAGACIPFILVVLRLGLIFPGQGLLRRGARELVLAGVLGVATVALSVHLLVFSPFSVTDPQPVTATQTLLVGADGRTASTSLDMDSPAPIRGISISTPAARVATVQPSGTGPVRLRPADSPVRVSMEGSQFLQQLNLDLTVTMPSRPRTFSLAIDSAEDFVLYDSSFPAVRLGPRSYRLLVGAFPPDELSLKLSFPIGRSFTLTLITEFDSPLIGVQVSARADTRVTTRVRVVRTLELKT